MFGKVGGAIVIVAGILVLFVSVGKLSTCLSDIRLVAVRASEFTHSGVLVFVVGDMSVGE